MGKANAKLCHLENGNGEEIKEENEEKLVIKRQPREVTDKRKRKKKQN